MERVLLAGSSGGHLAQLLALRPWWQDAARGWVCFDTPDATHALEGERVWWAHHPTTRNIPNLLRNALLALKVLREFRPTVIVSTGAAVALPFFVLGRLLGVRCVFIEVYDRVDNATLTGRLCEPFADMMAVQWPEQQSLYRDTTLIGPLL